MYPKKRIRRLEFEPMMFGPGEFPYHEGMRPKSQMRLFWYRQEKLIKNLIKA